MNLTKCSTEAVDRAFAAGRTVTVVENGCIVRKYPSGFVEIIKYIPDAEMKPDKIVYQME